MEKTVKFSFLSLCLLFFSWISYSQGNLQFNRVINYQLKADIATSSTVRVDTIKFCIPPNKVWKIENVGLPSCSSCYLDLSTVDAIGYGATSGQATWRLYFDNGAKEIVDFPFWLTSNFCGQFTYTITNVSNNNSTGLISIIEFNVVP